MSKAGRIIRKTLHREYKREMQKLFQLPWTTRVKLAWRMVFHRTETPKAKIKKH